MALKVETAAVLDALLFNNEVAAIVSTTSEQDVVARGFTGMLCAATVSDVDGKDAATDEFQQRTIKEIGDQLRKVADNLDDNDPATAIGAAEDITQLVTSSTSTAVVEEKFEKIAIKAIQHSNADTGNAIAAAATVYCIGRKAMSKLGGDVAFSNLIGNCVKKFLTLRYGAFFARDQSTGEWVSALEDRYGDV